MNQHIANQRLTPRQVLVIYHNERRSDFYIETRHLKSRDGRYEMMAAQPLSDDTMKDIAKVYIKNTGAAMHFGGLIDPHLLFVNNAPGSNVVIWYRPAMKRRLNFASSLVKERDSSVMVPATLYAVYNRSLYVFALQNDERPTAKTKLYKAPFFNIYSDGCVCLGTAEVGNVKASTYALEAERFERAFYMAEQNGGLAENVCKTPLAKLWTKTIKSKKAFPSSTELIQHPKHKTLGDFLKNKSFLKPINHADDDDIEDEEEDQDWIETEILS